VGTRKITPIGLRLVWGTFFFWGGGGGGAPLLFCSILSVFGGAGPKKTQPARGGA